MSLVAAAANAAGLRVFFGLLFFMLLGAGIYIFRQRRLFFGHTNDPGDTYASANLRMWLVILVWLHATVITGLMVFEV